MIDKFSLAQLFQQFPLFLASLFLIYFLQEAEEKKNDLLVFPEQLFRLKEAAELVKIESKVDFELN